MEEKILKLIEEEKRINDQQKVKLFCVGSYNAGKSTLLNSLIGDSVFKEGDIPTTKSIDCFETNDVIYYDTPGLNANDEDNECAYNGYKEADVILFVSNIQNGGLSAAEARYLKQIKDIMGDHNILKDNILFVLSNKHKIAEESVEKVIHQYTQNINKVLGLEPDRIYVYDALTYKNGIDKDEQILVEASGFVQLHTEINDLVKKKNKNLANLRQERLKVKRDHAQKAVNTLIMEIQCNVDQLRVEAYNNQEKIKQIDMLQQSLNNDLNNYLDRLVVSEKAPRNSLISLGHVSNIYDKKSKYEVKSYVKAKIESKYNLRESKVRSEIRKLIDFYSQNYLEYNENNGNYFCEKNRNATELVLVYASKFNKLGIQTSPSLVNQIHFTPQNTKPILSEMSDILSEDVFTYDFSVSDYIDLVDIEESEDYTRRGIFGGIKYKYSTWNLYKAIDRMTADINSNLNMNIKYLWGRIKKVIYDYNQEIKRELESRVLELHKVANDHKKMLAIDIDAYLSKITDALQPLSAYVDIPDNL